jgi:predicted RNA-binding Zn-ribbon protein involved in translation (DUF1610 family)
MARGDFERKAAQWMAGRLGPDDLVRFSTDLAVVLCIVELFVHTTWLGIASLALLAYSVWRMCSKNLGPRARENERFLKMLGPVRPWFQNPRAAWTESRTYKHVKCSSCGQRVRIPRGKGKLRVTCPTCHEKFEVRS